MDSKNKMHPPPPPRNSGTAATATKAAGDAEDPPQDLLLENILKLVSDRAHGQATNDQVEAAVSAALGEQPVQKQSVPVKSQPVPAVPKVTVPVPVPVPVPAAKQKQPPPQQERKAAPVVHRPAQSSPTIQADMEDYDDILSEDDDNDKNEDGDDDGSETPAPHSAPTPRRTSRIRPAETETAPTPTNGDEEEEEGENGNEENGDDEPKKQRKGTVAASSKSKSSTGTSAKKRKRKPDPKLPLICYEHIPLGLQGSNMMQTFGDGKRPLPDAVQAALLGARRKLQNAIQDARCVRRRHQKVYLAARAALQADKPQKPEQQQEWSSEIMYRAVNGHDALSNSRTKCGFDVEQLQQLFPEEMNAYTKWNEMRSEMEKSKKEQEELEEEQAAAAAAAAAAKEAVANGTVAETETKLADMEKEEEVPKDDGGDDDDDNDAAVGGHLRSRAAHFDTRTDKMQDDWYLRFAEVRRGSFLPARSKLSAQELQWDRQKTKNRGRPSGGVWQHMSAVQVRFLHWIGFDPSSALPPPNEETTACLGFLGYDFFGRIVEKAIFLRNLDKMRAVGGDVEVDEREVPLEMQEGEQLEASDIERAMEDPDIKPVPLYGASQDNDKKRGPHLYFGPGFEDRLEMELEE
jgi:hypothetical protein